jgi:glycosyltransferase involved in cell wall biosynthesis
MPNMMKPQQGVKSPLVSIITPSFNMARYIEEAVQSVLSQGYPRIEYILMDGGSTDGTLELLDRYRAHLRFHSAADRGAADAINKGFSLASGDILAWLSADDTYLPGTIQAAVEAFEEDPSAGVVYGQGLWTDTSGAVVGTYPTSPNAATELRVECTICQPTVFMRREAFEAVRPLDTSLASAFDYDLWIRLASETPFKFVDRAFATSRMHRCNKTLGQRTTALVEAIRVQKKNFGYVPFPPVYSYCSWRIERAIRFLGPPQPSMRSFMASLPAGLWINRARPLKYARDWCATLAGGVSRRLRALSTPPHDECPAVPPALRAGLDAGPE